MSKFIDSTKSYIRNLDKNSLIKIGLFLIPLLGIVFKGILLQGYIQNSDSYSLDLGLGFSKTMYFVKFYFAYALIFLSFSLLFKGKGRIIYLFIVDGLITALTLADIMYFRGFLTVPSVLILTQTANLDNMGGTLSSMLSPSDFLFFIDILILAVYVFFTRKSYSINPKRAIKTFLVTLILPIIYVGYTPFNLYVLNNEDVANSSLFDGYDPTNTAKYFSSIGYHIIDLVSVVNTPSGYDLTAEENEMVTNYYNWKNENLPDNSYKGIAEGKNLILIQVESLESFVIGQEINGQKITPVLDELINKSIYFPNIYEQVNEGTSSDCDLMMNTSLLPIKRGSTFFRYPNTTYNSLPKILGNMGYETASIHPDNGSFWNYSTALKGGIDFENFFDKSSFDPSSEEIGLGISDKDYFTQVAPKLKELNSPFYAHTITLTNHGPFDLPSNLRELKLDSDLDKSELGGYFQSVHYTDKQIGMFLKLLNEEGILDNSVVAIVGDHGGVHKYYNSAINQLSVQEDWYLDDDTSRVPFIIYDKTMTESKKFDTIGGQIDVMPTLLYALGVDSSVYENTALGRNLLNTNRNFVVLTNGTVKGFNLTQEEEDMIKNSLDISDKIITSDYFKNKLN